MLYTSVSALTLCSINHRRSECSNGAGNISNASFALVRDAIQVVDATDTKSKRAQESFINANSNLYTKKEIENLRYFLDAFFFKFQSANYSLEQLWSTSDRLSDKVMMHEIIRNSMVSFDLADNTRFLLSHIFEQYIFLCNSCLEFYMVYLVHLFRTKQSGHMNIEKFYKRLSKAEPEYFARKATEVKKHFETKVFSDDREINTIFPTNWGTLIKLLRDKITHRDRIDLSHNSREEIPKEIFTEYPALRDKRCDRFCQAMQNGMWYMICDLFPVLYDLEWQPGPYREGMFDT